MLFNIVIYITISAQQFSFFSKTFIATKYDTILTRILVLNGLCILATWTTIANLLNFGIVLQYSADVSAATVGTISLSLLTVVVAIYFSLENTILDKYVRYVFVVYPVVIWALIGVLADHWGKPGEKRNSVFALVLLLATAVLAFIRVGLFFIFVYFRPLKKRPTTTDASNIVAI